nr:MAG TPA: Protein of unknown function (DUF3795) [Caudoviricetes sp.]
MPERGLKLCATCVDFHCRQILSDLVWIENTY